MPRRARRQALGCLRLGCGGLACLTRASGRRRASALPRSLPRPSRRSLLERLLRARLVYQQPSAARAISFEYLNRQLVWSELRCACLNLTSADGAGLEAAPAPLLKGDWAWACCEQTCCWGLGQGSREAQRCCARLGCAEGAVVPWGATWLTHAGACAGPPALRSELLLFLLPLVNVKAIRHAVRRHLPRLPMLGAGFAGGLAGTGAAGVAGGAPGGERQPCSICSTAEVLQPWAAVPCGHQFCYYCLRSHCLADPQYSCPLCLRRVEAIRQVGPASSGAGGEDGGASGSGGVG